MDDALTTAKGPKRVAPALCDGFREKSSSKTLPCWVCLRCRRHAGFSRAQASVQGFGGGPTNRTRSDIGLRLRSMTITTVFASLVKPQSTRDRTVSRCKGVSHPAAIGIRPRCAVRRRGIQTSSRDFPLAADRRRAICSVFFIDFLYRLLTEPETMITTDGNVTHTLDNAKRLQA